MYKLILNILICLMICGYRAYSFSETGCFIYSIIAVQDKIDASTDQEFAIGDDDGVNNITEPVVKFYDKNLVENRKELNDYNLQTAISVAVGSKIEYLYDLTNLKNKGIEIGKIFLFNGNRKSRKEWDRCGRVKKIRILINNKASCIMVLSDTYKMQTFAINKIKVESGKEVKIGLEIVELYNSGVNQKGMLSEILFSQP